jgi:hypothetical protein
VNDIIILIAIHLGGVLLAGLTYRGLAPTFDGLIALIVATSVWVVYLAFWLFWDGWRHDAV